VNITRIRPMKGLVEARVVSGVVLALQR